MRRTHRLAHSLRRAFSLVELLTVIGILAIVIAIIIPVVGKARIAAKKAETLNTLMNVGTAIDVYKNDKKRYPGYFSAREMGDVLNASTNGFDQMSNMMLDLMGGITTATSGSSIITVGPTTNTVNVDLSTFGATQQSSTGATTSSYFTPDGKKMVAQSGLNQRFGSAAHGQLPSLIDAFGQPILAWAQDETPSADEFAADAFSAPLGAKFYWAQNAAFLTAGYKPGKIGADQGFSNGGSLIASDANGTNRLNTLYALLGNPAAPDDQNANKPKAARGPIILHSAGPDGVFIGKNDLGGKQNVVGYKANSDSFGGPLFDDQIKTAGH